MIEQRTLAFINLHAVLGSLENLCELVPKARELVRTSKPIRICFDVKNGPAAVLSFAGGHCTLTAGAGAAEIRLPFSSPEKFNGMIDGTVTPFPSHGFTKLRFLTKQFTALTDLLSSYLRPSSEALADPEFFAINTKLLFYTVSAALAQVANEDSLGRLSAARIPDGTIELAIVGETEASIVCRGGRLTTYKQRPEHANARMLFSDLSTANALFAGSTDSISCLVQEKLQMSGMIPMIDNINRVLGRVSAYLA